MGICSSETNDNQNSRNNPPRKNPSHKHNGNRTIQDLPSKEIDLSKIYNGLYKNYKPLLNKNSPPTRDDFPVLNEEFDDYPILENEEFIGYGVKQDRAYSCNLKINELNDRRVQFWKKIRGLSLSKDSIIANNWETLRNACCKSDSSKFII